MEVPVLVVCASCESGSILHVEPNEFTAVLAEEAHGRLWFRKKVECPDCKSMIELEFALDTKTGQAKSEIRVRKPDKKSFLGGLFGGSSNAAATPAAPEAPSSPPAAQAEPPSPATAEAGTSPASGACKAFQAGRCVVNGADTGPCDWDPSSWRTCNVVIENMKHGAW